MTDEQSQSQSLKSNDYYDRNILYPDTHCLQLDSLFIFRCTQMKDTASVTWMPASIMKQHFFLFSRTTYSAGTFECTVILPAPFNTAILQ
jgi:hypothetical protein